MWQSYADTRYTEKDKNGIVTKMVLGQSLVAKHPIVTPSVECKGFCCMGLIGSEPNYLKIEDHIVLGRTKNQFADDRKDCLYV